MGSDLLYSPLSRSVVKSEPFSFDVDVDASPFFGPADSYADVSAVSYLPTPTTEMFFMGGEVEPMLSDAAGSDEAVDVTTPTVGVSPSAEDALAAAAAPAMVEGGLAPTPVVASDAVAAPPARPKRTRRRRSGGRFTRRRRTRKRPGLNANGEVVETEVLKAQKAKHLAIERRRRDNINHQIDVLRELVPTCRCGEYKGQVLSKAVEYIQELEDALAQAHRDDSSSSSSSME